MFNYMQRLGKSLMLPIATLPICAILMGIGYMMAPASMGASGEVTGWVYWIGTFLNGIGGALINNIGVLFAIGVGVGMSKKNAGTGAMAALASWLIFTCVLNADEVNQYIGVDDVTLVAFKNIQNPFIGILSGIIGSSCCNKFSGVKLPDFLAFFSGKRCVPIVAVIITALLTWVLMYAWPILFSALVAFGNFIVDLKGAGVGIYAFANRLLIPTGLHHALNNVFWFDTVGIGDLTKYWAGLTSDDVGWSLGMYMSGFFPCMMFGVAGGCLAMVRRSKNKKHTLGILSSIAICAFLCGVTEPFEFMFVFVAFPLYVWYSLLYGIFAVITYYVQFRAGFSFSGGLIDLVFSSSLPAAQNTWLIIPLGIGAFAAFYVVFSLYLRRRVDIIPGNGGIKSAAKEFGDKIKSEFDGSDAAGVTGEKGAGKSDAKTSGKSPHAVMAAAILEAIGGVENLKQSDHCITRLRLTVKDSEIVDEEACKAAGAAGVMKPSKSSVQIIIGPQVQSVFDEFVALTGEVDSDAED